LKGVLGAPSEWETSLVKETEWGSKGVITCAYIFNLNVLLHQMDSKNGEHDAKRSENRCLHSHQMNNHYKCG